jgi:hypothetical protein
MKNPLTGRMIQIGKSTHRKLLKTLDFIVGTLEDDALAQMGGEPPDEKEKIEQLDKASKPYKGKTAQRNAEKMDDFYENLLKKSRTLDTPLPARGRASKEDGEINIPKSKYHLISSALPPNPEQHSWYHHHAPFSQNFGDYVCLKKSTLQELGLFLRDSLLSDIKN